MQQMEVGASVHLALDELETVDLPFHQAITPGMATSDINRVKVVKKTLCKLLQPTVWTRRLVSPHAGQLAACV
jgi:hypothetical protein